MAGSITAGRDMYARSRGGTPRPAPQPAAGGGEPADRLRDAILAEARRQRAANPDEIFVLLPRDAAWLDDNGQPVGVADAVTEYLAAHPEQRTRTSTADGRALFAKRHGGTDVQLGEEGTQV